MFDSRVGSHKSHPYAGEVKYSDMKYVIRLTWSTCTLIMDIVREQQHAGDMRSAVRSLIGSDAYREFMDEKS